MPAETEPAVPASVIENGLGRGLVELDELYKQGGGRLPAKFKVAKSRFDEFSSWRT